MSMFTITYFELEPLVTFSAAVLATVLVTLGLPRLPSTHIPSVLFFVASMSVLVGMITGTGWALLPAVVLILLLACGVLARKSRPEGRTHQG
ncbi:hypothetical protein [Brachybacterium saurashtrense]|uniref:hypothetical protein n=1 Tax=Brachybacterium saurashtrense TaxID=556288 RepID=UPI000F8D1BD1|nr:hypothetical protein [Brachybacterium saurashtrense]